MHMHSVQIISKQQYTKLHMNINAKTYRALMKNSDMNTSTNSCR